MLIWSRNYLNSATTTSVITRTKAINSGLINFVVLYDSRCNVGQKKNTSDGQNVLIRKPFSILFLYIYGVNFSLNSVIMKFFRII